MSGSGATSIETAVDNLLVACRAALAVKGTAPETGMYKYFDDFLADASSVLGHPAVSVLQQSRAEDLGVPDFRIQDGHELKGWVEVKAVINKPLQSLTGHDKVQTTRFREGLHNVVLTNGWQWRLFQNGKQLGSEVTLGPDTLMDPSTLPVVADKAAVQRLGVLLGQFFAAQVHPYSSVEDAVTALAARARGLKSGLLEAGEARAGAHITQLKQDFASLLYKNGLPFTWERFVDSYVQIAAFGSLLWRLETGSMISLSKVVGVSHTVHPLIAECLHILWDPRARIPILEPLLEELCRTVNLVNPSLFHGGHSTGPSEYVPDPIIEAYEPFFKHYDPAAREQAGVYYTPGQVVSQIVSGIDHLLKSALGRSDGILDPDARFLDPATGTGTFLLGLANAVAKEASRVMLPPDQAVAQVITNQVAAFEIFPGPYTVAHQRLEASLTALGAKPISRLPVYLADTLAAPMAGTLSSGFGAAGAEIQRERQEADAIKTAEEILVIFGNPPYERIRLTSGALEQFAQTLLDNLKAATPASYRRDLKSTNDLYVAFWLWSLWALQPASARAASAVSPTIKPSTNHGIVAFITNRTWIIGRSLTGLRALVRAGAKEVWIYDLGGDNRGSHGAKSFAGGDASVFGIETGTAIAWVVFDKDFDGTTAVHYRRLFGSKSKKLDSLASDFDPSEFVTVSGGDAFLPMEWGQKTMASAPTLDEVFAEEPHTGLLTNRDTKDYSPIATQADELIAKVAPGSTVPAKWKFTGRLADWTRIPKESDRYDAWVTAQTKRAKTQVPSKALDPNDIVPYAYRPFDRRFLYNDERWVDWDRPELQKIYRDGKAKIWSLVTIPRNHGRGPAAMHVCDLMDQHVFRGSAGGKAIFPLHVPHDAYSTADPRAVEGRKRVTFSEVVLDWLDRIGRTGSHARAYDYLLAVLSAPSYTESFWRALEVDPPRVPLSGDPQVFDSVADLGSKVREAWELGVAPHPSIAWAGKGTAELGSATMAGGKVVFENGRSLSGVTQEMKDFEVSGYPVLRRWFAARSHWQPTLKQAKEALVVVSSVKALVELGPRLDGALTSASS